ncbi:RelA/SpoT domain-containing protein [Candidatus Poriferisodalis sp.]|uniref:RelA/SpoT domain-containing protein n=1 Tax=Candidatus Poriferisodalis sp. TaxID=3101277 RepID=UPI003B01EA8D
MGALPPPTDEELRDAARIVEAFRAAHKLPMLTARMGLQSCVSTKRYVIGRDAEITQRLKRRLTVWDKLRREPTMKLSRMQDIGGCRAVLPSLNAIAQVRDRFTANSRRRDNREDRVIDYVEHPRDSGYRAVHIRTHYRGRRVEVQLRTRWQHRWARIVEDLTNRVGVDYKSGSGPEDVHRLLIVMSDTFAERDAQGQDPAALDNELRGLMAQVAEAGGLGVIAGTTNIEELGWT